MRLYLIAMLDEAKDIIKTYELVSEKPFLLYKKENNLLAITNIGKVNSAFVATHILSNYKISEVINLGFVGGSKNFNIGDYVLVEKAIYHDFDLSIFGYEKGIVPNISKHISSDKSLFSNLSKRLNKAILYTGDKFLSEEISDNYIVDMEGASIYQVCHLLNIPVVSVKVVSDIVGHKINDYNEFEKVGSKNILNLYELVEKHL